MVWPRMVKVFIMVALSFFLPHFKISGKWTTLSISCDLFASCSSEEFNPGYFSAQTSPERLTCRLINRCYSLASHACDR